MKEFTTCHWEKKMYTSTKTSPGWKYCTVVRNQKKSVGCIGIHSAGLPITSSKSQ